MKSLFIVAVCWVVAAGIGRSLLDVFLGKQSDAGRGLTGGERFVMGSAAGLGVLAYGVFALGMVGLLTQSAIACWIGLIAFAGLPGLRAAVTDFRMALAARKEKAPNREGRSIHTVQVVLKAVLALLLLVAVAACYQPPGAHAWDALAYHLADPKVYLLQHRISVLPTEHHSNFPFTMEMLFTIGLAFDGVAAANLFHLLTGVLLVVAVILLCDRLFNRLAGLLAATVLASTPLALWEATVAYIDLGLALYLFLAAYLLMVVVNSSGASGRGGVLRWMALAGLFAGFALAIKYLALVPVSILACIALWRRVSLREVVVFVAVACAIGSPWYIKSAVWMRNPVYPFAFSLFPHSKYWSADRAVPYAEEQRSFGTAHSIAAPAESLRNLVLSPWKIVSTPEIYTNRADFTFTSLIGGLYAALLFAFGLMRKRPPRAVDLTMLCGAMFVSWFFISQHIRYLIPMLPFGAVVAGYTGARLAVAGFGENTAKDRSRIVNKVAAGLVAGAVLGHLVLLGWGITSLPVGGREAAEAQASGLAPTALSVPEALEDLSDPAARDRHRRRLNSFGAIEWINTHVPSRAGVVLYEDVLGFYLDRPYLWGNGEHSAYIPYERLHGGHALTLWLRSQGYSTALFNLNNAPANPHSLLPDDIPTVESALLNWYPATAEGWRGEVGEALQSGEWRVRYVHHGVAVLDIGPAVQ